MRDTSPGQAVTLAYVAERLQAVDKAVTELQGVNKAVQELQRGQAESLRLLGLVLGKIDDPTLTVVTGDVDLNCIRPQDQTMRDAIESEQEYCLEVEEEMQQYKDIRASTLTSSAAEHVRTLMKEAQLSGSTRLDMSGAPSVRDVGVYKVLVHYARRVVGWRRFEYLMGLVIFANAVTTGVETQMGLDGHVPGGLAALEHVFLSVYTLELCLRLLARGRACFRDGWYLFDLAIVVVGIFSLWVVGLVKLVFRFADGAQVLAQFLVIRVARLLRLLRAVRMVQQFRSMWRLVYGLLTSFNTMISTLSLVGLVLYIFACLGIELITLDDAFKDGGPKQAIVEENFGTLARTMIFLWQFVTLDSVAAVYVPIIRTRPLLVFYFVFLILVVSISLMNMVMAKIVEGALDAANADREVEREQKKDKVRKLVPKLYDMFRSMDEDQNGKVTFQELESALMSDQINTELKGVLKIEGARELFAILDIDNSGEVSQEEFIEGILNLNMTEMPLHQVELLQLARYLQRKVNKLDQHMVRRRTPQDDVNSARSVRNTLHSVRSSTQSSLRRGISSANI